MGRSGCIVKKRTLYYFGHMAGMELNPENRWVKMAQKVDWEKIEDKYLGLYCANNKTPAKPIRLAICALLISSIEGLPDERLVLHIQKNPYMQYFCGMKKYTREMPFTPSLMVTFRKRFDANVLREINEMLFAPERADDDSNDDDDHPNRGILIMDAICAPANITYPQYIKLCD